MVNIYEEDSKTLFCTFGVDESANKFKLYHIQARSVSPEVGLIKHLKQPKKMVFSLNSGPSPKDFRGKLKKHLS